MNRSATNEPNRLIATSIGLARPADDTRHGYLSEHHFTGETVQKVGDYADDIVMEMLATTLCLPNDSLLNSDQSRTMETFRKNLQNTKYYKICRRT